MEMIRTFHPVGQGAFYSEEFIQDSKVVFRVVYDCGCIHHNNDESNAEAVVNSWIDRMGNRKTIDYLFISHFDYDHVSLLRVFKDRQVCVRRVVLPLISKQDALLLTGIYDVLNDEDRTRISQILVTMASAADDESVTARELFEGEAKVIRVRPVGHDNQETSYDGKADVVDSRSVFQEKMFIGGAEFLWRYVPFNYDDEDQRKALINMLADKDKGFGPAFDPSSLEIFPSLMQNYEHGNAFSKIKKIYDRLDGRINLNSQMVCSAPAAGRTWRLISANIVNRSGDILWHADMNPPIFCRSDINEEHVRTVDPGCFYTGDVNLKKVSVEPWCRSCFGKVGTVQIPHHGSRLSFEENAIPSVIYFCPISCSVNRYYKHPHSEVVKWLEINGKAAVRVTEKSGLTQKMLYQRVI